MLHAIRWWSCSLTAGNDEQSEAAAVGDDLLVRAKHGRAENGLEHVELSAAQLAKRPELAEVPVHANM